MDYLFFSSVMKMIFSKITFPSWKWLFCCLLLWWWVVLANLAEGEDATEIKIETNNIKRMNGNKIQKFPFEKEIALNGIPINHTKTDTKVNTTGCI